MKKSEFENIVIRSFRTLEARHGFKKGETVFSQKGCTVEFSNATTNITLNYEIGGKPWLAISDIADAENKITLDWLLVERGVEKAPTPADAFRPTSLALKDLGGFLEEKNKLLLEHGMAFVTGDFSLMPVLQKRAKKYAQDCERYIAIRKSK
jgi:hypothetical protein